MNAVVEQEDLGLVSELISNAARDAGAASHAHVNEAVEAVLVALGGNAQGQQSREAQEPLVPLEQEEGADVDPGPATRSSAVVEARPTASVAALAQQVSAAVGRVSELRSRVVQEVVEAIALQAEALRPALQAKELSLASISTTPGKMDRRRSMDLDAAPPTAALALNENLLEAVDKLPALRARMDEVSKRLANVLRAVEEQKAAAKTAPTPLRSITPLKRRADTDSVVGIVARATCQ